VVHTSERVRGEEATTRRGSCARIHEGEGARGCELVTKGSQEKTHCAACTQFA
jgi:hypothetical protein